ncbi:hypothetical protein MHU86_3868 [Fragilaria crotonensis]|nr:hypothetical protein MHU86_3868 [Fragilaria crotonensis]
MMTLLLTASKSGLPMRKTTLLHGAASNNFVSHLCKKLAAMWEDYMALTHDGKKPFFVSAGEAPDAVNLQSFVQPEATVKAQVIAKQKCSFAIDGDMCQK